MRITIPADPEAKSWQDFANCLGVDPDLFFPERGASTKEAKAVCRGCVGARGLPRVRPGQRREVRHLGRTVRARTAPAPSPARHGSPAGGRGRHRLTADRAPDRVILSPGRPSEAGLDGAVRPEVELVPAGRIDPVEHRLGYQTDQLGPGHRRLPGHDVEHGVRPHHLGVDEVHRHLHVIADPQPERPHRRAPQPSGHGPGGLDVAPVEPQVVGDERRPGADGTGAGGRMRRLRTGVGRQRGEGRSPHFGQRTLRSVQETGKFQDARPPTPRTGREPSTASAIVDRPSGTNGTTSTTPIRGWAPE